MTETAREFDCIVVGLGQTGRSAVEYLLGRGLKIAAVDSRRTPPGLEELRQRYPRLPLHLGGFHTDVLCRARQLLVSPGVSVREPAIQEAILAGVAITSDVEIFCQQAGSPVIAVTGSNGKSTVVTLLAQMIEQSGRCARLAGNIGAPVLQCLGEEPPDYYVLELSSFQLETLQSLNAVASVVLNITPDHMDRYTSFEEYAAAKQRIYAGGGKMVLNRDDPLVSTMAVPERHCISFGLSVPGPDDFGLLSQHGEEFLCRGEEALLSRSRLHIAGEHNVANALAALAVGSAVGLPMEAMLTALTRFTGLPHRCQWLAKVNGVDWYDDSKGTNVGATCAAISGLAAKRQVILIAGGEAKDADFSPLAGIIGQRARAVVLMGRDAVRIERALAPEITRIHATGMESAVRAAAELARTDDIVLLSPACGSQDMYRDYRERGRAFSRSVQALAGQQQ